MLNQKLDELNETYSRHVDLAKIVFKKNKAAITGLGLSGRRDRRQAEWLAQAKQFYENMLKNEGYMTQMERFKQTKKVFQDGLGLVSEAAEAFNQQHQEMGEAQQATKNRDALLEELEEWTDDYLVVARVALTDQPQLLEALGVLVRS